jgi:hypothetical protein
MRDELKEIVCAIAEKMNARHPNDIEAATDAAVAECKALGENREIETAMIWEGWRNQIYAARDKVSTSINRQRFSNCKPKVNQFGSKTVQEAYISVYSKPIAGRTLGDIKWCEIPALIAKCRGQKDGWGRSEEFLVNLQKHGPSDPKDQTAIRDSGKEKIINNMYATIIGAVAVPDVQPLGDRSDEFGHRQAKRVSQAAATKVAGK